MHNLTAPVRLPRALLDQLRSYSQSTGVTMTHCVEEAVENWLATVAPKRISALRKEK